MVVAFIQRALVALKIKPLDIGLVIKSGMAFHGGLTATEMIVKKASCWHNNPPNDA